MSLKQKVAAKCTDVNEKLGVKYPTAHKKASYYFDYCSEVWKETFPNNKVQAKTKIDDRRERAKMVKDLEAKMKELTPEELEAYMESIPEWKRGALVIQENQDEEPEEVEGVFRRIRGKISGKVMDTTLAKDLLEKEGENIAWARKEYQ